LDAIAPASPLGLIRPVAPGITPGSGPGHLALFGYDPVTTTVGRGVLEALGAGFALQPGDVAARANFCTLDAAHVVTDRRAPPTFCPRAARHVFTDRRAGRIPNETCARLVEKMKETLARILDVDVRLQ